MGIGARIKELREAKKMKQGELAKLVGVTASAIGNYENEVSHPKEIVLYKLIEVLNCDANYLFQDVIKKQNISNDISFTADEQELIDNYRKLNNNGKETAFERVEEMAEMPKYTAEYDEYSTQENVS